MTDIYEICRYGSVEDLKMSKLEYIDAEWSRIYIGFIAACEYGNIKMVEYLVSLGLNEECLNSALYNASIGGHINIVELLIKNGATNLNNGIYGCERAITKQNIQNSIKIIELLMFHGASVYPNKKYYKYKLKQVLKFTKMHELLVVFVLSH